MDVSLVSSNSKEIKDISDEASYLRKTNEGTSFFLDRKIPCHVSVFGRFARINLSNSSRPVEVLPLYTDDVSYRIMLETEEGGIWIKLDSKYLMWSWIRAFRIAHRRWSNSEASPLYSYSNTFASYMQVFTFYHRLFN